MRLVFLAKDFIEKKYKLAVIIFFIVFLLVGISSIGDFGISTDEAFQYTLGHNAINLVLRNDQTIFELKNKFHGTAFTIIMSALQRSFNLNDLKTIYTIRHYFSFFLFYISVIFFYFLCRNIFLNWKLGLLGSIFLVLSPRIFADSFYNPKDLPFLSAFIIAAFTLNIYLSNKNAVKLAVIHGIATGFAASIRILGIMIPFFTILLLILDHILKRKQKTIADKSNIKQEIKSFLIYILISIIIFLFFMPSQWPNPIANFFATIKTMSDYPYITEILYMGQTIKTSNLPWHYLPVHILITTPIFYTVLFFTGLLSVIFFLRKNLKNFYIEKKFVIISILWFFIPVLGVIIMGSNMYAGWRHMYFIYPAFLIISLQGIGFIYNLLEKNIKNINKNRIVKVILSVLLFFNMIFIIQVMAREHPYEYVYFNTFAGRNLKEVGDKYLLDYWGLSYKSGLDYILKTDQRNKITYTMRYGPKESSEFILSKENNDRLIFVDYLEDADYLLTDYRFEFERNDKPGVEVFNLIVDGGNIMTVFKLR